MLVLTTQSIVNWFSGHR